MEMFELRYFVAVSETQNISKSAKQLHVSASALCKAISRLEDELGVALFRKEGRNICLTEEGRVLARQASRIFEIERETRKLISTDFREQTIHIAGPEIYLSHFGVELVSSVQRRMANSRFEFRSLNETDALEALSDRTVDACFVSDATKKVKGIEYFPVANVKFGTFVSSRHPLGNRSAVPISEVIGSDFACPAESILGGLSSTAVSTDGWRDDKFKRKVRYWGASLKVLEGLIQSGQAVGYLPIYYGQSLGLKKLNITGCSYRCDHAVFLAVVDSSKKPWLRPHAPRSGPS